MIEEVVDSEKLARKARLKTRLLWIVIALDILIFGYAAYEGLIVFDKANPAVYCVADYEYHPSPVRDRVCVNIGDELSVTIPYTDPDGNDAAYVGMLGDHAHWNIAKYMIGKHDDAVIAKYTKENDGISPLDIYIYLAGQTISVE